jgi:diguanylate cyclase (GGDEF)-like protein
MLRGGATTGTAGAQVRFTLWSLALTSGLIACFYLLRAIVFVAVGPDHTLFRTAFGSEATTLLTLVLLVVVTFSMSEMSHVEQTTDLREQATHDPLTGVLNRAEFLRLAEHAFAAGGGGAVVVGDIDDFKTLNDAGGHAAGDAVLIAFAAVCLELVDGTGLVGRLGGDEFALYLPDLDRAPRVADEIRDRFTRTTAARPPATVSFGIAPADCAVGVKDSIVRADVALYQAKAAGRDRVVVYGDAG